MQQYLTPERIANAIMLDKNFKGFYLIVEGKKDYKLYSKFICDNVQIKQAFGKEKVREVLDILEKRNFQKKFAILDLDFDKISKIEEKYEDIFKTDYHDSEVMILNTKALENVINNYCDIDKIKQFQNSENNNIRDILFCLGEKIGKLRLANYNEKLGLVFKPKDPDGNKLKYSNFISNKDLSFLGLDKLIETVVNYSTNRSKNIATKEEIDKEYLKIDESKYDIRELINGHDLTNILFIFIKKVLRSSSNSIKDSNCIEESLVLAYETNYFKNTKLYKDIKQWSNENNVKVFNFEDENETSENLNDIQLTS